MRVGKVTDVNRSRLQARVLYQDSGMTSDWLQVLVHYPLTTVTGETGGGEGMSAFETHSHSITMVQWMPKINDIVLVLYLPVRDGDGFILGQLR